MSDDQTATTLRKENKAYKERIAELENELTKLKKLEDPLRQAQKLEAVGRLAGGVAHDFNNLLTAILGAAELMTYEIPPRSKLRGELEEIRAACRRAEALTRQLLAFSRRQILRPQVLKLNAVVLDVVHFLGRIIGEDIKIVTALDEDVGRVLADVGQLEQVIMNLAVNARDAMPQGGILTLETSALGHGLDDSALPNEPPGPMAMLSVSDTGCGMDEATLEQIFEPFFSTKDKSHGAGLGLAAVYGIVRQSGGQVRVHSELNKGSCFKIYLPQVSDPTPTDELPAHKERNALPRGIETILVVEDDARVLNLTCRVLRACGYTVLEGESGEAAMALVRQFTDEIHLLLTDVVMPGISGGETARRLSERLPDLKVIYMSGYTDDSVVRNGVQVQGSAFLPKPFTPRQLARKLREVLDGNS